MTSPLVSVVIPLFNKQEQIGRTLLSVRRQAWHRLEVVVVDDGSEDDGARVVRDTRDDRIRYVRQANQGPGAARNTGARLAQGELLVFLDADDELEESAVQRHVEILARRPSCALSVLGHRYVPALDAPEEFPPPGLGEGVWRLCDSADRLDDLYYLGGWFCCGGAAMCRRKAFEWAGGFYEKHRCLYGEDHYLWVTLLLNFPVHLDWRTGLRVNTEGSALGLARLGSHPPRPIVTDPAGLFARCPPEFRRTLSLLRARYALLHGRDCISRDRIAEALRMLAVAAVFPLLWGRIARQLARIACRRLPARGRGRR